MEGAEAQPGTRIRVLIADDDEVVRTLLEGLIGGDAGMELVGSAANADDAIALAAEQRPDVAVLDWVMPNGGGPAAARAMLMADPDVRIVALTAHDSEEASMDMLRAGAASFIVKGTGDVLEAIRSAAGG